MDPAVLKRVQLLMGDAYTDWGSTSSTLDVLLTQYGDIRLVAAFVLEEVAEELLAEVATAANGKAQVKRVKDGDSEVEYFAAPEVNKATRARLYFERAGRLRAEAAESTSLSGSSVALDIRTGF